MRLYLFATILCAIAILPTRVSAQPTDFTWIGGSDGDIFNSAANWNNGAVTGDIGGGSLLFDDTSNSVKPIVDTNVTNIGGITFDAAGFYTISAAKLTSLNMNL